MGKLFLALIFLTQVYVVTAHSQVNSDWKWSHPKPQGQDISSIQMIDDNNWVACGWAGLFMRTSDAGNSWLVNKDAGGSETGFYFGQGRGLNAVWFFDANTGFVVGSYGWIARTTNGGVSWDTTLSPVSSNYITSVKFTDANTGYASCTGGIFLKTINQGLNWTVMATPYTTSINNFDISGSSIFAVCYDAVIFSTNGGTNWSQKSLGSSSNYNGCLAVSQDTCIISGASGNVWTTYNGGANWTQLPSPLTSFSLDKITKLGNKISVIGSSTNIYQTTNYGTNWTSLPFNISLTGPMSASFIRGNTWLVGGDMGVFLKSTNQGQNWTSVTDIRSIGQKFDIWAEYNDGKVWAVGSPSTSGTTFDQILYSSNGGSNWGTQFVSSNETFRSISMIDANNGWVSGTGGAVYKTSNGGLNWVSVTLPGSGSTDVFVKVIFMDLNNGYVFDEEQNADGTLWKTTNGGLNWTRIIMPDTANYGATFSSASFINVNTGWAVCWQNRPYKTTNGGLNWTIQTNTPSMFGWSTNDIKMVNENTGYICGNSGRLWKTSNGGVRWDSIITPYTVSGIAAGYTKSVWFNGNLGWLFAGTGIAIRTTNGGISWTLTNTGGGLYQQGAYARSMDSIFVLGYNASIFKMSRPPSVNVTEWTNIIPGYYNLEQNYPNPFNPVTTISFGIPKAANISLIIYDITGREIDRLINNTVVNAGTLKYTYDASKLASGVYFYSLIADGKTAATKKMVLIK
ncbi:MAG: YCF48-related protein [Bacteroidetes bacterium]|nr:YCF48-related protein [Bacteroidota bacterium]